MQSMIGKTMLAMTAWLLCSFSLWADGKVDIPEPGGKTLLHSGWLARKAGDVLQDGSELTLKPFHRDGWMQARVPGTVLTTLLDNKYYPAPEFGLNNNLIPDVSAVGNDFYTYWFVRPFEVGSIPAGRKVWLNFRGINYRADIFLNGKRLNTHTHEGMFLRESYDMTPYLKSDGHNMLAVIVYPPTYPGNPNGGQGGDGMIARNNTMQYTPGWDWIQSVRDRNTGIWDEVSVTTTGDVCLKAPYVVTKVPGKRIPDAVSQKDAIVKVTAEVCNTSASSCNGLAICETNGMKIIEKVSLLPFETKIVAFKSINVKNPRLWWPNGIGKHPLYDMTVTFVKNNQVSDKTAFRYGIREITSDKDPANGGRRFFVNGQKIYITGGNYINSDWLLRLSPERYRDEIRFHAEMNLRMIRVWGGALLERPEFYNACDEEGMLVFQDLWGSGDCNGAWPDALKAESRERRWEYPDNHELFLASVEDQVKMIRNHPSLCFWCGANEWPLAKDIDRHLKEDVFPRLDPNRLFASYSTDTLFTANPFKDNGDGPYGIQEPEWFYSFRSYPFNPESGSVGSPEVESMKLMMSVEDLAEHPRNGKTSNASWNYHRDLGYGNHLERYGKVENIEDYCKYAQTVNYDQYRSFMEGRASHMWDWYTGILIWKTQNPWTSLRGQMYDWWLDVNACLYGTLKGCEPLHASYNILSRKVELLNTTVTDRKNLLVSARLYNRDGKMVWEKKTQADAFANSVLRLFEVPRPEGVDGVYFLKLQVGENVPNIYWLTTDEKDYTTLSLLPNSKPQVSASIESCQGGYKGKISLKADGHISFFNRIKVIDTQTGERILPVHYSDNYITLMPGDSRDITFDVRTTVPRERIRIVSDSWTHSRIEAE